MSKILNLSPQQYVFDVNRLGLKRITIMQALSKRFYEVYLEGHLTYGATMTYYRSRLREHFDYLDMNVGGTPLKTPNRYLQLPKNKLRVFIKDERFGPTNSFKDRQAALVHAGGHG